MHGDQGPMPSRVQWSKAATGGVELHSYPVNKSNPEQGAVRAVPGPPFQPVAFGCYSQLCRHRGPRAG